MVSLIEDIIFFDDLETVLPLNVYFVHVFGKYMKPKFFRNGELKKIPIIFKENSLGTF